MAPALEEAPAQAWIEATLGVTFDASLSFEGNLKSGVRFGVPV